MALAESRDPKTPLGICCCCFGGGVLDPPARVIRYLAQVAPDSLEWTLLCELPPNPPTPGGSSSLENRAFFLA